MSIAGLIGRLKAKGITLWLDGDRLRVRAPSGALDDEAKAQIKASKGELTALLQHKANLRRELDEAMQAWDATRKGSKARTKASLRYLELAKELDAIEIEEREAREHAA